MKKICILIPAFTNGGVTSAITNLAVALKETFAHVHIISFIKNGEATPHKDLNVHYLYVMNLPYKKIESMGTIDKDANNLIDLVHQIENIHGKFDLFLSNTTWCDRVMAKCNFPNSFYIIHESIDKTWKNITLFRAKKYRCWSWFRALRNKSVICVSEGIAEGIKKSKLIKPSQIKTIYNTFNISRIKAQKNEFTPNIPTTDYIIHVGRFCKEKRYDILFMALKKLPNVTLVLLVKHSENAEQLAKKYEITTQLVIVDFQKNPFPWIASAKLLVLSSDTEGLGMVLIESLICGTPVVSTDCDYGPREILTGELEAYLSPINNADALAENIRSALQYYPDVRQADILQKVAPDTIAQAYLRLCETEA